MDRNTLLAITLCFLIYAGWQKYYLDPKIHPEGTNPIAQSVAQSGASVNSTSQAGTTGKAHPTAHVPHLPKTLQIHTGTGDATLSDGGSLITAWNLKSYKLGISPEAAAVDLHSVTQHSEEVTLAFDDPNYGYISDVQGTLTPTPQGALWTYEDSKIKLTREILASDQKAYLDVRINAEFKDKHPNFAFISVNSQGMEKDPEAQDRKLVYWANQSIEGIPLKDSIAQKEIGASVKYIGAMNRYFMLGVVSQTPVEPNGLIQPTGAYAGRASLVYPVSGNSISLPMKVYFGPKELELLRQVDPTLDHAVDFGWFTVFAYPLLKTLKWFYLFFQNYGLAIILLTVLLKVVTYPLTYKSMKSMKKMAKLQPQLQKLRDKYKDDRESLNREMMAMMKTHGYNPMAGCLPMVIQMPIFFALYRVLYSSIELYHAPFALWIHDLSSRDPFYVTPVLLSLTMFVQQKLTPNTATDPTQAKMMQLMPLMFGAFMLALPSGLTLYMLVNAIASIIQQLILNKKLDPARAK